MNESEYERGVLAGVDLLGTCDPMPDGLLDESESFCTGFDETTRLCDVCGWWVSPEEECPDCA